MHKGNIIAELEKAFLDNPKMTAGEIFFSFLHKDNYEKNNFFYVDDEAIFLSIEKFNKFGVEKDDLFENDEEFEAYIETMHIRK